MCKEPFASTKIKGLQNAVLSVVSWPNDEFYITSGNFSEIYFLKVCLSEKHSLLCEMFLCRDSLGFTKQFYELQHSPACMIREHILARETGESRTSGKWFFLKKERKKKQHAEVIWSFDMSNECQNQRT